MRNCFSLHDTVKCLYFVSFFPRTLLINWIKIYWLTIVKCRLVSFWEKRERVGETETEEKYYSVVVSSCFDADSVTQCNPKNCMPDPSGHICFNSAPLISIVLRENWNIIVVRMFAGGTSRMSECTLDLLYQKPLHWNYCPEIICYFRSKMSSASALKTLQRSQSPMFVHLKARTNSFLTAKGATSAACGSSISFPVRLCSECLRTTCRKRKARKGSRKSNERERWKQKLSSSLLRYREVYKTSLWWLHPFLHIFFTLIQVSYSSFFSFLLINGGQELFFYFSGCAN